MTKFGERDYLIVLRTKIDIMCKQESSTLLKKVRRFLTGRQESMAFPLLVTDDSVRM